MSAFLGQRRVLTPKSPESPTFPARFTAQITFGPEDAFGVAGARVRTTCPVGRGVNIVWNTNDGTTEVTAEVLGPLTVDISVLDTEFTVRGNVVSVNLEVPSLEAAERTAIVINQSLPPLLSLRLGTSVWITEFRVEIGDSKFRYETRPFAHSIRATTLAESTAAATQALSELTELTPERSRLLHALYYFRQAHRLFLIEPDRHSMCAEVLLNLSKAIGILLTGDRDRIRERAKEWGLEDALIEKRIIPIMLLRSQLGVAHAIGTLLRDEDLLVLDAFTTAALEGVRKLLEKVFQGVKDGAITLPPPSDSLDQEKQKLIEAIRRYVT